MKKVLLSGFAAIILASCATSGTSTNNTGSTSSTTSSNTITKVAQIANTVSQITGILGANTNLTSNQTSSLTSTLTKYITNYNSISSLASTDTTKYTNLLTGYKDQALTSVKETVSENQYAQILSNLAKYKQENAASTNTTTNAVTSILASLAK